MRHFPMIAALLLVGCASAAPRPPQSAEMGLQQTSAAWTESFKSRDPDQIIPFFTDDVIAGIRATTSRSWDEPRTGRRG